MAIFTSTLITVIGIAFAIWLHTKSGKRWLDNL